MPVYRLPKQHAFPPPEEAEESGLLAVGGDLDPARVLLAYYSGIFPWYSEGEPVLWWSPDPRMVLRPSELRIPRSLKKKIRRGDYSVTMNQAFKEVIRKCRSINRPSQSGTWITEDMIHCYEQLHQMGFAHSVETWEDGVLVGGLYGVSIGTFFAGESMFALRPDASKFALVALCRQLGRWQFPFIDCQMHTEHLARFGATEISRSGFLEALKASVQRHSTSKKWVLDPGLQLLP